VNEASEWVQEECEAREAREEERGREEERKRENRIIQ
jgi:hypothetical protein